jgi:hypothetical protein
VLWRIEMLGGLRAVSAERIVTRFRTHKAGALLAYLAFHQEASHPRDLVQEVLWPEEQRDRPSPVVLSAEEPWRTSRMISNLLPLQGREPDPL